MRSDVCVCVYWLRVGCVIGCARVRQRERECARVRVRVRVCVRVRVRGVRVRAYRSASSSDLGGRNEWRGVNGEV